jgi:hypothetical protein
MSRRLVAVIMAGNACCTEESFSAEYTKNTTATFHAWGEETLALIERDCRMPDSNGRYLKRCDQSAPEPLTEWNLLWLARPMRTPSCGLSCTNTMSQRKQARSSCYGRE